MSGSQPAAAPPPDPSMDDILASIRRILAEDENVGTSTAPVPEPGPVAHEAASNVLVLDDSMVVHEPPAPGPLPVAMPVPIPAPVVRQPPPFEPAPVHPQAFEPPAHPQPGPRAPDELLVAPETAAASSASMSSLIRHLAQERSLTVTRGGPSLEDVIRDEMRPILKHWLDTNLPALVERLVRAEIARVVDRSLT